MKLKREGKETERKSFMGGDIHKLRMARMARMGHS
jgi:hypothetical protein